MNTRSSSCDASSSLCDLSLSNGSVRLDNTADSLGYGLRKMCETSQCLPPERRKNACAKTKKTVSTVGVKSYPCCSHSNLSVPPSPPIEWPQRPMLLCPSPESGMKILGIRYSSSRENLSLPGTGFCKGCTLPINNGYERPGKCLVIDFETDQFIGTAMLRVKNISAPFQSSCDGKIENSSTGKTTDILYNKNYYFAKKKRTFQATVRGIFKQPGIPVSECITGQVFNRPAGYLPPRLIVKGAVAIISRLAPQLQVRLEGDCPRFLSPLVSTAQTVLVHPRRNIDAAKNPFQFPGADESIEANIHEPQRSDQSSIMQSLTSSDSGESIGISKALSFEKTTVASRMRNRKRAFDKIFSDSIKTPTFDVDKEYTFEFFQHLITFDDFSLDFVKPVGKHSLHRMLNGQPLKFMAARKTRGDDISHGEAGEDLKWFWCFDLWHESLYEDALRT